MSGTGNLAGAAKAAGLMAGCLLLLFIAMTVTTVAVGPETPRWDWLIAGAALVVGISCGILRIGLLPTLAGVAGACAVVVLFITSGIPRASELRTSNLLFFLVYGVLGSAAAAGLGFGITALARRLSSSSGGVSGQG